MTGDAEGLPACTIGIDPGLNVTGYGVIGDDGRGLALVEGGVIRTEAGAPLEQRLRELYLGLRAVMEAHPPHVVVVEDLFTQYTHPRTAVLMGHARGVVYLCAAERAAAVVAYPPALVKRALTGNGRAPKEQVARMVAQLLNLDEPPSPADVTDALALALCHSVPARQGIRRPTRQRRQLPPALAELLDSVQRE